MKTRLFPGLTKPILTKFRKPLILLLFSIILSNLYKEEKKEKNNENNLNFHIVDEKNESIKRLDIKRLVNINELFTLNAMISIRFTNSNVRSLLSNFSKENEKVPSLII